MGVVRIAGFAAVLGALALNVACANPRAVTKMTGTVDQVKLVYQSKTVAGIIECKRSADGTLEECKELPVEFLPKGAK